MNHSGSLIARIALWVIAILGIVFIFMIYSGEKTDYQDNAGITGGLWVTYIAFFVAAGMAVIFALMHLFTAGKNALPTLIGLGVFIVLLGISYAMADSDVKPDWNISGDTSKWIGAGITMTMIAAGAAILAIVYGEITRMLK